MIDRPDGKHKKDGAKQYCITKFLVSEYFPRLPIYNEARKGRNCEFGRSTSLNSHGSLQISN